MTCSRLPFLGALALLTASLAFAADPPATAPATQPANPDVTAIAKTALGFTQAFAKADAAAVAAHWLEDGDYTGLDGVHLKGRKAIQDSFTDLFSREKGLTARVEIGSIRFPTPDTAVEEGVTSVLSPDGSAPSRAHYINFLVKRDSTWKIASCVEATYIPPNNAQNLQPLAWVVGEWVEDVKEGAPAARVVFDWTPDMNFLYSVRGVQLKDQVVDNGSQRIAWDPASKTIRCWNFESDGGFSEGAWKPDGDKGDKWTVTSSHVLRSGSLLLTTTTLTKLDPDTVSFQVSNQKLDGKPLPDSPPVKMKRVK